VVLKLIASTQYLAWYLREKDGVKMRKAIEMLEELDQMEFCIEDECGISDSDPIEAVLESLLQGKSIKVAVWKDYRNRDD
jgi:hypothetical protein